MILLPKVKDHNGNLSKMRPITLLESFKKLYSAIFTARLTKTFDNHDILRGHNNGFRTGKSTADSLMTLRLLTDDANLRKKLIAIA